LAAAGGACIRTSGAPTSAHCAGKGRCPVWRFSRVGSGNLPLAITYLFSSLALSLGALSFVREWVRLCKQEGEVLPKCLFERLRYGNQAHGNLRAGAAGDNP